MKCVSGTMGRKNQYFGVKVGRKPGVYTDWSECKTQIIGVESAKWKRFSTYEEANVYCCTDTIKIEGQGLFLTFNVKF